MRAEASSPIYKTLKQLSFWFVAKCCRFSKLPKQVLPIEMQLCRLSSARKSENCFTGGKDCKSSENNVLCVMLIWTEKLSQNALCLSLGQEIWKSKDYCRISSLILPVLGKGHCGMLPESIQDLVLGTRKKRGLSSFLLPLSGRWANPTKKWVKLLTPDITVPDQQDTQEFHFILTFAQGHWTSTH